MDIGRSALRLEIPSRADRTLAELWRSIPVYVRWIAKLKGRAPIVGGLLRAYRRRVMNVVGRYEILREIGRGGMAIVYAARQPDLDRQVALKELSRFHASSAEFAHRFLRESRLAGSLNHPNIVTVHEYFEHRGTPYIAMELVPRGSLRPYAKLLSIAQVAGVLEGVMAALAHAETAGIVHRDMKPENVMVTADGRVKITDFGIARATQRAGTHYMTATGMTVGTPIYVAPERAMAGEIGPWTGSTQCSSRTPSNACDTRSRHGS